MKVVVIGASPYDILPIILNDFLLETHVVRELVLVELNAELLQLHLTVAQAIARAADNPADITGTRNLYAALPGADMVLLCPKTGDPERWLADKQAMDDIGLGAQARAFGGLGGLLSGMRSAHMLRAIADSMRAVCPKAPLLLRTPPLDLCTQAVNDFGGVRAYGTGAVNAQHGHREVCALLGASHLEVCLDIAGIPGAPYLLGARDSDTHDDLLPEIEQKIMDGAWGSLPAHILSVYGALPVGDLRHHTDRLPDMPDTPRYDALPTPGTPAFQRDRLTALATVATDGLNARGRAAWASMMPVCGIHFGMGALALIGEEQGKLSGLMLPNTPAYLPDIPAGIAVQVPLTCCHGSLVDAPALRLPVPLRDLMIQHGEATRLAARAAWFGDRSALREAVEQLPALDGVDRLYALDFLSQRIEVHRDVLPQFFDED